MPEFAAVLLGTLGGLGVAWLVTTTFDGRFALRGRARTRVAIYGGAVLLGLALGVAIGGWVRG